MLVATVADYPESVQDDGKGRFANSWKLPRKIVRDLLRSSFMMWGGCLFDVFAPLLNSVFLSIACWVDWGNSLDWRNSF